MDGQYYRFLGSVGTIVHGLNLMSAGLHTTQISPYGTNNEFGFDYLRDNMVPMLSTWYSGLALCHS